MDGKGVFSGPCMTGHTDSALRESKNGWASPAAPLLPHLSAAIQRLQDANRSSLNQAAVCCYMSLSADSQLRTLSLQHESEQLVLG